LHALAAFLPICHQEYLLARKLALRFSERMMSPAKKAKILERKRGLKESSERIKVLQDKWPMAFAKQASMVRPLANVASTTIAEAFGWSVPYARAVLMVWKSRPAYCTAVLAHPKRINLDGSASDEEVDERARLAAKERLAVLASRPPRTRKVAGAGAAFAPQGKAAMSASPVAASGR
jgi:sRNA-binding protein